MVKYSRLTGCIVLLCNVLVALSGGVGLFFAGLASRHGPGATYTPRAGWLIVALSLFATASSLFVSVLISRCHRVPGGGGLSWLRGSIFLLWCVLICLCEYTLFLQGQVVAMHRTLESEIANSVLAFGLYAIVLFSFYAILWAGIRRSDLPVAA